ncbi:hypothetical protein HB848_14185 [Listeria rocourtiae]|uniref:hypothetical protein n=1 Tax=Listeria rocourtiae TaxID=647910 RepID=UPI0016236AA3|nr:hypothetical protein [Listeria rocourtiae]
MNKQEKIILLKDLVNIDSTNGNEKEVADYLLKQLTKYGISSETVAYTDDGRWDKDLCSTDIEPPLYVNIKISHRDKQLGLSECCRLHKVLHSIIQKIVCPIEPSTKESVNCKKQKVQRAKHLSNYQLMIYLQK